MRVLTCVIHVPVFGQQPPEEDAQALAKKLANPISDMVSIQFRYNWENGVGTGDDLRTVLNIQPTA